MNLCTLLSSFARLGGSSLRARVRAPVACDAVAPVSSAAATPVSSDAAGLPSLLLVRLLFHQPSRDTRSRGTASVRIAAPPESLSILHGALILDLQPGSCGARHGSLKGSSH